MPTCDGGLVCRSAGLRCGVSRRSSRSRPSIIGPKKLRGALKTSGLDPRRRSPSSRTTGSSHSWLIAFFARVFRERRSTRSGPHSRRRRGARVAGTGRSGRGGGAAILNCRSSDLSRSRARLSDPQQRAADLRRSSVSRPVGRAPQRHPDRIGRAFPRGSGVRARVSRGLGSFRYGPPDRFSDLGHCSRGPLRRERTRRPPDDFPFSRDVARSVILGYEFRGRSSHDHPPLVFSAGDGFGSRSESYLCHVRALPRSTPIRSPSQNGRNPRAAVLIRVHRFRLEQPRFEAF